MSEWDLLRRELAALKAQMSQTVSKDMSLVTLVKTWTGKSVSCGLQEFFNSVDTTGMLIE
jgi:hypothetical protein